VLTRRGVPSNVDDEGLLDAARSPDHKLAVTLLSCWTREGRDLDPAHRAELAGHRHRADRYAHVWARSRLVAPGAHLVKGPRIAAHYPDGVLRAAGDLDVVDPDEAELWQAAVALVDEGWQVEAFTVLPHRDGYDILLSVQRRSDTILADQYEVELRTPDVAPGLGRPSLTFPGLPDPVAPSLVALVAERLERPFTSRDVLDLGVLSDALTDTVRDAVRGGLTTARLWPAYRELCEQVERSGLKTGPLLEDPTRTRRQRRADLPRRLAALTHPVRAAGYLATSTVDADRGRVADRLVRILHERVGGRRLLRAGVPLFGVPVDGRRTDGARMLLADRGHRLLAATPVGTFLLTAGACPAEWLDDLSPLDIR
jgi:hypothetical protein